MIQERLYDIIISKNFDEKIKLSKELRLLSPEPVNQLSTDDLIALSQPGRPNDFLVVGPRAVPKRNLEDKKNRINFLHAIANIELLAIELPALCLLRYGSDNSDFVVTQFKIMADEATHFELLRERLKDFGCDFGNLPVHNGLWDHAWRCESELEHQVLIPCYLEARGLDVSPEFMKKFIEIGDEKSARIMKIILAEEVGHVKHGLKYLDSRAKEIGLSSDELFRKVLTDSFGDKVKSKVPVNENYRKVAGFSENQIRLIKTGS